MKSSFVPCDMPIVRCEYDPRVDLHPVDQFGFLDINKAYSEGIIEGSFAISDEAFNGVQDPDVLLPRPKDRFEAMRQADYVKSALKAANSTESNPVSSTEN